MKNTNILFLTALALTIIACKKPDYSISISSDIQEESIVITKSTPVTINYSIVSPMGVEKVDVESSANIITRQFDVDQFNGIVTASLLEPGDNSYVRIKADNGVNQAEYVLSLEMENIVSNGKTTIDVGAEGGPVGLNVKTNVECEVVIPEDAADWISFSGVESKAMAPFTYSLDIAKNEDVNRSAQVTVRSKTAQEVNVVFTISQAGILKNLRISTSKSHFTAPDLLGSEPEGKIFWGDKFSVDWIKGAEHTYVDGAKDHIVEIHTKATGFEFVKMTCVSKIDIKDF